MTQDTVAPPVVTQLLTTREASDYLRNTYRVSLSHRTLEAYRETDRGPKSSKIGSRVYYSPADLDTFVTEALK